MEKVWIETDDGVFAAHFSSRGLAGLDFPTDRSGHNRSRSMPIKNPSVPKQWLDLTREALTKALAGQPAQALPPIDLSTGTPFQRQVWEALRAIPTGQTATYAGIAQVISRPKAGRAVGQACGANPIPVLIPCHRVVAAHGGLGGFSGGLKWKTLLLSREGVTLVNEAEHRTSNIDRSTLNFGP